MCGSGIDIGFGYSITDFGNGGASLDYSKRELYVPEGGLPGSEGILTVGVGIGSSGDSSTSFDLVLDANDTLTLAATVTSSSSSGAASGSSNWSRRVLADSPGYYSDITGAIIVGAGLV